MLIANDKCGSLNGKKRRTLKASYTPLSTGIYTIEFYNYRNSAPNSSVNNYIDDITLEPQYKDLFADDINISVKTGGVVELTLNAGPVHSGEHYLLLASFGDYPCFTMDGFECPLVRDRFYFYSLTNANTAMFQNTIGTLDGLGIANARFSTQGVVDPLYKGQQVYFAYALLKSPMQRPLRYVSIPVMVNFIP